jgi:hypothetical protein
MFSYAPPSIFDPFCTLERCLYSHEFEMSLNIGVSRRNLAKLLLLFVLITTLSNRSSLYAEQRKRARLFSMKIVAAYACSVAAEDKKLNG